MVLGLNAEHELLTAVTAVLVVTLPVLIRQHYAEKALRAGQLETQEKVDAVVEKLNGVETEVPSEIETLRAEMRAGFARLEVQTERVEPPTPPQPRPKRR